MSPSKSCQEEGRKEVDEMDTVRISVPRQEYRLGDNFETRVGDAYAYAFAPNERTIRLL